jgi:hypothetical protein
MNQSAMDVLQLLRLHWDHYCTWLPVESNQKIDNQTQILALDTSEGQLRDIISLMIVQCCGRTKAKLRNTCLSRKSILAGLGISPPNTDREHADRLRKQNSPSQSTNVSLEEGDFKSELHEELSAVSDLDAFSLLDVEDPEHQSWDFLSTFGVTVKLAIHDLVARLRQLVKTHATKDQVALLYDHIQPCAAEEDIRFIRCTYWRNRSIKLC